MFKLDESVNRYIPLACATARPCITFSCLRSDLHCNANDFLIGCGDGKRFDHVMRRTTKDSDLSHCAGDWLVISNMCHHRTQKSLRAWVSWSDFWTFFFFKLMMAFHQSSLENVLDNYTRIFVRWQTAKDTNTDVQLKMIHVSLFLRKNQKPFACRCFK